MKLASVVTHEDAYFPYLLLSCKRYNTCLDVVGWGEEWKGFRWRLEKMLGYLQSLDDHEVVCFVDGHDVILLRPLEEMEELFRVLTRINGVRIVVGAEGNYLASALGTCRGKVMCMGTIMGFVSDLVVFIESIIESSKDRQIEDDQIIVNEMCKQSVGELFSSRHAIYTDTSSLFFLTTTFFTPRSSNIIVHRSKNGVHNKSNEEESGEDDYRLYYRDVRPFFLHGNANTAMESILQQLGYPILSKSSNDSVSTTMTLSSSFSSFSSFPPLMKKAFYYAPLLIKMNRQSILLGFFCIVVVVVLTWLFLRTRKQKK